MVITSATDETVTGTVDYIQLPLRYGAGHACRAQMNFNHNLVSQSIRSPLKSSPLRLKCRRFDAEKLGFTAGRRKPAPMTTPLPIR